MGPLTGILLGFACAVPATLALNHRDRRARRVAETHAASAERARDNAERLLRVAADDLRGPALTLRGHAEQRSDTPDPVLAALAARLLTLCNDLAEQGSEGGSRTLHEEEVPLAALLEAAITHVATALSPGRRHWRLPPELGAISLRLDRRAMHQVLVRVLANAAWATRDQDWIDISFQAEALRLVLAIEDEGSGLPIFSSGGVTAGSRGIGFNLFLAQILMQSHGGGLAVESTTRVGTRVCLILPRDRLVAAARGDMTGTPAPSPSLPADGTSPAP